MKTWADILIVDDEPQVRQLLKIYLKNAGYKCREAEDVATAKKILEGQAFDLILSDIDMPWQSGFDLIRHVKANCPDTPMIMVSIIDDPEEAKEALEMGVYGYIVKPFTRNIVLINVENALCRKRLEFEKKVYLNKLEALVRQRTKRLDSQLAFLQTIIDAIPSPIGYKNKEGVFQGCNTAFENLTGKRRETIIGKTALEVLPKKMADISLETDKELINNSGKIAYECEVAYPDQSIHNFLLNKASFLDDSGNMSGVVGVMVDITARKAAEEALRLSEEKFRKIAENIGISVAMISPEMKVLWMNNHMCERFPGVKATDQPVCYRSFCTPARETPCDNCPTVRALKDGKNHENSTLTPMTVGEHQYRIIASPIHGKDGKVVAAIELVEDITEKIVKERELHQAQKLESIGQLAAGIAHEINTPIQYIGDNTRFIQDAASDLMAVLETFEGLLSMVKAKAPLEEHIHLLERQIKSVDLDYLREEIPLAIEQTLEGVSRVSKIVTSMRHFSHPGTDKKCPVDLNNALETTITVARNEWKYVADLETDFDSSLPLVFCLPGEMNQVFLNLLINAAQAIGEFTDDGRKGKGLIRISTRLSDGIAQIMISDTGGGIPKDIQQRIFDPFFTTKAVGKGTGQGLAIAHTVISEKHAGSIHFETGDGQGTTFIIELPVAAAAQEVTTDEA